MAVEPKSCSIEGLAVTSTPLPPFRALDLLPEIAGLVGPGAGSDQTSRMLGIIKGLGSGKLRTLLPQLLAGTKVTITDGGKTNTITLSTVEMIDLAFDGRMRALPGVIMFALEVSFADFLAGLVQAAEKLEASP